MLRAVLRYDARGLTSQIARSGYLIPSPFSEGTKHDAISILVECPGRTTTRAGHWEDDVAKEDYPGQTRSTLTESAYARV